MKTYRDFLNAVIGRAFDIDKHYGAQCWDGYAYFCMFFGVPFAYCVVTGYVRDIWEQRHSNGILKYFDEVTTMEPGDVCVFTCNAWTPYSHIAIFDSDAGGGFGNFLGQNQGGPGGAFNIVRLPYSATFPTAFRLKSKPAPAPQKIGYQAHCQDLPGSGWQEPKYDGQTAGTTGQSRRMEAFRIFTLDGTVVNSVSVYADGKGWLTVKNPGKDSVIGTTGQSRPLYSVKIKTSRATVYRVHRKDKGWSEWMQCDGKAHISEKDKLRIEAIEIKRA